MLPISGVWKEVPTLAMGRETKLPVWAAYVAPKKRVVTTLQDTRVQ